MAGATVRIKSNLCASVAARFPSAINKVVREQVLESEGRVKINIVSYGAVDTGMMLGSVKGEMTDQFAGEVTVSAESGDGFPYPAAVNYGTVHMSPRPFFSDEVHRAETAFPARFNALARMLS